MSESWKDGILQAQYLYNPLGQRVLTRTANDNGAILTRYFYDLQGHLLTEHRTGPNGAVTVLDYLWLDDRPLALIKRPYNKRAELRADLVQTTWLHADHLNTPRIGTDETGTVVWRWDSDAFGAGGINNDPDADGNPRNIALRFPGQFADIGGLYYNYFRDYSPGLGRYVQSDPIGLGGGVNTYTYVGENPISYVDPLGLWRWPQDIYNDALQDAANRFPGSMHNGIGDAYRHCLASCMVAKENSELEATLFGWANEKKGDWTHNQEAGERAMDDFNNQCGRDAAENVRSTQDCVTSCMIEVNSGQLQTYNPGTTAGYWDSSKWPWNRYP